MTYAKLRKAHMKGKHAKVPCFGCPLCIAARDAFWVCRFCDTQNPAEHQHCGECGAGRPGSVIEISIVPNTTPIKVETGR